MPKSLRQHEGSRRANQKNQRSQRKTRSFLLIAPSLNVIPKIVVEVAYNEIQKSPKYKSQMALQFARISRIRDDKSSQEADTIDKVREIYERQFRIKGRYKTE
ncbi:MAG: hypothetical protein ABSB71_05745 [Candidatus Bathyarchaeia archaeon]